MRLTKDRYDEIQRIVVDMYESCNITTYPISCQEICNKKGIRLFPYSSLSAKKQAAVKQISPDGIHMLIEDIRTGEFFWVIYYNDENCRERIRWTLLHEIGHIVLDHTEESDLSEAEANFFAKYALAPPPLVMAAKCEDYIDIAMKFDISQTAAFYSMKFYNNWMDFGPKTLLPYESHMLRLFGYAA